ncbi:MAG: amidase, partial [Bradyrhizobium sp.]|nr:amidase [Bradyrhizobium sp.]
MSIKRPNAEEVADLAASLHMNMTVEEAAEYLSLMGGMFDQYDIIDELPNPLPPVKYPRTPGA